uniref:Crinkler effector protein N-terminal domain-containing protein n=1 Tax=Phytophthora fragariae TaxID=53985 RepID=A0A6A3ETX5_9STRA|nr:hypothetical protein PF009_g16537 [Phytophthora fragariae]
MPPQTAASPRAEAPAASPPSAVPGASVDLAYVCRGVVDVLEGIDTQSRVSNLRKDLCNALKETFDLDVVPAQVSLKTFVKVDGEWPAEADAEGATTRATVIGNSIATEFEGAGAEGRVHLLVEVSDEEEVVVEEEKKPAAKKPTTKAEEYQRDVESDMARFNKGCVKRVATRTRKASTDDDDVIDAHVPFSEMTEFQYKCIYKGVTINDKHVNETTPLPKDIMDGIRDDYARYIITRGAPWEQNEAQRRAYIASGLDRCIFAVNTAFPVKEEMKLLAEYPIDCDGLRAGGNANWVVKRGDRMLIVIEAKQCDLRKGRYQLLAMMEALRICNKKLDDPVHTLNGICADFQNWLFADNDGDVMNTEITGCEMFGDVFPESIVKICERVYHIMLNL